MADPFKCYVRRIDFEPKMEFLESRIYAHVFLKSQDGQTEVDVYTDNPRFEAAFLTAFSSAQADGPPNRYIEVYYELVDKTNKVVRVTLDKDFILAKKFRRLIPGLARSRSQRFTQGQRECLQTVWSHHRPRRCFSNHRAGW